MTFKLKNIVSFHIGGRNVSLSGRAKEVRRLAQGGTPREIDPNGDYQSGQMYVQGYLQENSRHRLPVLLWHGGGMTGVNWETTPDGRPGWLHHFLEAGYDVYISDAVERGRSGWNAFPDIYADAPLFRTKNEAWDMFRLGEKDGYHTNHALRVSHPETLFPLESFDQFACQWVPRWADHEMLTMSAYRSLLEKIGPAIVIGHSQGGGFALKAAQECPELVWATVALEPSGAPDMNASAGKSHPHLIMWGDHIHTHRIWAGYRKTVDRYVSQLREHSTTVEVIDLPKEGVRGNTHFLMMDRNARTLATRVIDWLDGIATWRG
ncbi:esterase [Burkholderia sp. JP2-270]|uniref:alpha/beta fold hydrolase n=1 Tax=Burkholderia sp. JP2-270 TaxID=2217913 RepID=UPI000DA3C4F3|nr:alpha/beta fold hydrolase [Burkholderia sp. JP2-270]AWV04977.1 esterase [Burkholderia sp. JP2-270]